VSRTAQRRGISTLGRLTSRFEKAAAIVQVYADQRKFSVVTLMGFDALARCNATRRAPELPESVRFYQALIDTWA
jgi:hypothetical protein